MHIVVCIKQVPDSAQIRVHPVTNTIMRQGVPTIINPYDLFALEAALRLRDKHGGSVTVLTMGPPMAEDALRKALTYGADDAVLLTDRAFAGSDTLATSYALSPGHPADRRDLRRRRYRVHRQADHRRRHGAGRARHCKAARVCSQLTYVARIDAVDLEGARDRGPPARRRRRAGAEDPPALPGHHARGHQRDAPRHHRRGAARGPRRGVDWNAAAGHHRIWRDAGSRARRPW